MDVKHSVKTKTLFHLEVNVVCPHWKCADDALRCLHEKNVPVRASGEAELCTYGKCVCFLSFLYPGIYRVLVPRVPQSDIVAEKRVIISSSWPDDVIQLR